ncbi:SGNH/GDSL hydrolase family protein [Crossiella sp. NPDC003009]
MSAGRVGRVAVILLTLGLVIAVAWVLPPAQVRIMPLGDSITGGPGCWRAVLWHRLRSGGRSDVDFVGPRTGGGCPLTYDRDHAGYSGYQAARIAREDLLPSWLAVARPHIVLMHLGTNDLWHGAGTDAVLAAYAKLVGQLRARDPDVRILLAQIIPMRAIGCDPCAQRVLALNGAIPRWAAQRSTARSPITVVDQWTGFDAATDTIDGVHPNDAGFRKMADRWLPAVTEALNQRRPPGPRPPGSPAPGPGRDGALPR